MSRPVIRTKEHALIEAAAELRAIAIRVERYADDVGGDRASILPPPAFPSPPPRPRPSLVDQLRTKKVSVPAAGAWVAVVAIVIDVVRDVLHAWVQQGAPH